MFKRNRLGNIEQYGFVLPHHDVVLAQVGVNKLSLLKQLLYGG